MLSSVDLLDVLFNVARKEVGDGGFDTNDQVVHFGHELWSEIESSEGIGDVVKLVKPDYVERAP